MKPWEFEALSWLTSNKNKHALATNRFTTTAEAIEAVKKLHAAGATEVKVGPVLDEPERIKKERGPYADMLVVLFPKEKKKKVLTVAKTLRPDNVEEIENEAHIDDETHGLVLMLTWD